MIGILDVDLGNLRSVANAIEHAGHDAVLVHAGDPLDDLTHLILPGVGNFRAAMTRLEDRRLVQPLRDFAASGRPFLGICLGMQLLATSGDEGGSGPGLGLIPGHVRRFDEALVPTIPHVGWNGLTVLRKHPLLTKVKNGADVYFVHSYHLNPADPAEVIASCDAGQTFAAIVGRGNVVGCQFHPEKSMASGLRIIENFCEWDGAC